MNIDDRTYPVELSGSSWWVYIFLFLFIGLVAFIYFFAEHLIIFQVESFSIWTYIVLFFIAFVFEFFDGTFGVGFGTILAPFLLLLGFEPLNIIMAILLSQFVGGLVAGVSHHIAGNVNFQFGKKHIKVAVMVIIFNIIGIFIATLIAVNISEYFLKVYIGLLVLIVGLLVLFMIDVRIHFSWLKIVILGILASFNKGMSGGGYGPVITGGQIISGVETKGAIGITTLSEGITCFAGLLIYMLLGKSIMWSLALPLILGSLLSAPLGALFVSRFREKDLMKAIGILCLVLGMFVALKIFASG